MKDGWLLTNVVALMSALQAVGFAQEKKPALKEAWSAWEDGEIVRAQTLARKALVALKESDEAHHLLILTAFVTGNYHEGLDHYRAIGARYRRLRELTEPVIDAHVHLGDIAAAAAFARARREVPAVTVQRLEAHAARALRVDLDGVGVVPFADHPLTEYFPAFVAGINGHAITAHLDTGGAFLLMGPQRAAALGIRTANAGTGRAHLNLSRVEMSYGIAERFVLGGAVLHNVPVEILSTLTGENDWVIFGTNVLERFLSTMDYPNRRLILSRRGDGPAGAEHLAMLPSGRVPVPFYLWSDHFMFARGGLGERRDLNFFVDSGLVSLHPDGTGGTRQASFTSSARRFKEWGISGADINRDVFESRDPLSLGSLREERPLFVVGAAGDTTFGGVRIDGLISHAFFKRHTWTIDFDRHEYRFASRDDSQ